MRTRGRDVTNASRQRDRAETTACTTRARRGNIEDPHLRAAKVNPIDSHRKRLAAYQFHAYCTTLCKGSRALVGWTRDVGDEPVVEDVQAVVKDTMQMVAESDVPHPFETVEMPHPSKTEALTTTKVTPQTDTQVFAIETTYTNDMGVTHPVESKVNALVEIEVTASASTELSVHIN